MLPELSDEKRAWYILQGYYIRELKDLEGVIVARTFLKNGMLHREDGPAREAAYKNYPSRKRYYLNDELLPSKNFLKIP